MTFSLTADLGGSLETLKRMGQAAADAHNYAVAIVNSKAYAASVEKGMTREVVWSQMTKAQRFAILKRMEEKYGPAPKDGREGGARSYKRDGTTVERAGGRRAGPTLRANGRLPALPKSFKLHIPGVHMVEDSKPVLADFMHSLASTLSLAGPGNPFERLVDETALFGLGVITEATPVGDGGGAGLAGAWSLRQGVRL